jgi:phosphate starvation-inducible membrane PsiE
VIRGIQRIDKAAVAGEGHAERVGNIMVDAFLLLALFVIGATIVWSAVYTYIAIMGKGAATIDDILLLFIFLELGAMVGIYFKTNRLPVQFLLYVAITVMTRTLSSSQGVRSMEDERVLVVTGGILILALAVFVLRFASHKYPAFEQLRPSAQEEAPADSLKSV